MAKSAERMSEWVGSLADLMAMIEAEAIPACIVVMSPGAAESVAGEIHLLAGGLSDAFAGSLRRDDAVAALRRIEGARLLVETRLPDPESGSLSTPAHEIGSLADRPLTVLMRYCEDYVLTGRLLVRRGAEQATLQYNKGELVGTLVNGSDDPEGLPSVLAWVEGDYIIQLPKIPGTRAQGAVPVAKSAPTPSERKRHATLPMSVPPVPESLAASPPPPREAPRPVPPSNERTAVYSSHAPVTRSTPVAPPRVMDVGVGVGTPPPLYPPLPSPGTGTASPIPGFPGPMAKSGSAAPQAPKPVVTGALPARPAKASPSAPPVPGTPPPLTSQAGKAKAAPPTSVAPAKPKVAPTTKAPAGQPAGETVASNDLKPASGTIEARPVTRNQIPVPSAPVEVAPPTPKPMMLPAPMGQVTPPVVRMPPMPEGRRRDRSRKFGEGGHSVRTYVFVGLAVGIGVVLAYWAYWYLPFGH
jgi:hypothetical protein